MTDDKSSSYAQGEKGAWLGIISNFFLFVIKLFAGIFGRSQAMIADAFHTASDFLTSFVVLVGFRIAAKPADSHHPFGHGRAESIAAKIVSIVLIFVALKIAFDSAKILVSGTIYTPGWIALAAACFSILVKEVAYRRVIVLSRKINSSSLRADAYHHRSDVFSSVAAFIGITGARMGFPLMDPLAGILVSAFILKSGIESFHVAYDELMDAAPPESLRKGIETAALTCRDVKVVKKVMVRKYGIDLYVEIIIGVDGGKTVEQGHLVTDMVTAAVEKAFDNVKDVIVHVEPVSL